ncbi:alpha/beta fold hydrolase [Nitrosomonas sp. Nm132]|jgi:pimeloyl-ACP methyl ester carboxylesterase/predicted DCC family thiol-disulfide oxidoreductase YuxK|uniref:alpha/beta fold hydrolase n=1 Tax=Nitrosomonas sp. Nm132 TaxID=1881053 RepID=UPI0008923972|nr:alpha/beta fold hydrolase [Nitrosomonas sp. Nm132]SDH58591.1 Pimeloyl-ACP methyl ester carboxylesterase [Nitrosomonas sp. Nm132]
MGEEKKKITVYYDGACPACIKDRQNYEKLAGKGGEDVCWFDITGQDAHLHDIGIDPHKALSELHVHDEHQRIVSELDAYIVLMARVPLLKPLAWLIGLPVIRPLLSRLYHWMVNRRLKKSGRLQIDEKRHFQSKDGVTLTYRRWTPAQNEKSMPLVLLHGAASNSSRWWHFTQHSRLAAGRLLLRPDLRGHGESIWRGPARIEKWCQDIAELLQHEQQSRAIIVGHCLGANIALNFAARYPDRCAGLVLIEPIAPEAVTGVLARLRPFIPLLRVAVALIKLFNWLGFYRRQLGTLDLQVLDRRVHQAGPDELKTILADYGKPKHDLKVIPTAQYLNNLIEIMRPLPVAEVRCPALVIQSGGLSITDPKRTQALLQQLPQVEFATVDSEHWLPATHPDELCELIDRWVLKNRI